MTNEPKRTHLYDWHKKHSDIVDFVGWKMPVRFTSIREETMAVREGVGVFDTSNMFRFMIEGPESADFLQYLTTNNVKKLNVNDGHYSTCLNEHGGTQDDLMLYRVAENQYIWVTNAANGPKIWAHMLQYRSRFDVEVQDKSHEIVMIAVQGPKALELLSRMGEHDVSDQPRFSAHKVQLLNEECYLCRTGYTGETGGEILLLDTPFDNAGKKKATAFWEGILDLGAEFGIKPCGLGARDAARLEAGFVLYGHELDEETSPIEARIPYAVKFKVDPHYIGYDIVRKQKKEGVEKTRIGLVMVDRGIPRQHYPVLLNGEEIGEVTSGTMSPVLSNGIGMAYVKPNLVEDGDSIEVGIKGRIRKARVTQWPFYDPDEYGESRKD